MCERERESERARARERVWTDGKGKEGERWREGAIANDRVNGERPTEREREHWRETGREGESKMRERGRERKEFVCAVRGVLLIFLIFLARSDSKVS